MSTLPRALAAFLAILCVQSLPAWADTPSQEQRWETWVGQQRYAEYQQRGEIVPPQSPLYRILDPIGHAIAAVANRQYFTQFHFVVLNEQTPNAFSMPGGNVYVTTALLSFLKNRDELAGVICHEVNHDIHHDMYAVSQATQGRSSQDPAAIAYERAAETNADRAGAYTCAKAGFNPWGMVWTFRQYRQAMGVSNNGGADHPSDRQREADLVALFESHKSIFGKFSGDVARATPLGLPQVAQRQYSPYGQYPSRQYTQQYYPQPYSQYPQQSPQYPEPYSQYPQPYAQYPQQYPQQPYPPQQYPQQQYPQQQYPQQQYPQYPQYPQQYPQQPYPPYPPPPCYPGC